MRANDQGYTVNVLYVNRRDAKTVKVALEKEGFLHKQFRMTQPLTALHETKSCIAIPITPECLETEGPWSQYIVSTGRQHCPYSSSFFASHKNQQIQSDTTAMLSCHQLSTRVQQALFSALIQCSPTQQVSEERKVDIIQRIRDLSIKTCPKKLEVIGDDRTLVIPRRAFRDQDETFASLLALVVDDTEEEKLSRGRFWKYFASAMSTSRVVRRGDIDPDSSIRESGHRLVWPYSGQPKETGPGSPGWITITEQGISQSFDITRVMFSRGNITEKIRFGKLVQEGETVLDMYAGIGYYTLPALVYGKAAHVYACEWNEHAANALKYNLAANGVDNRASVLIGDCRQLARTHNLINMFDRVSLGLLPSSEGGWRTAVNAIRHDAGGWLHVHGNVPDVELSNWKLWMCLTLLKFVDESDARAMREWVVVCLHVERVKSYAPNIHHYVADVFIGPSSHLSYSMNLQGHRAGVLIENEVFTPCPVDISPPSCALSPDGALHQSWMMENDS